MGEARALTVLGRTAAFRRCRWIVRGRRRPLRVAPTVRRSLCLRALTPPRPSSFDQRALSRCRRQQSSVAIVIPFFPPVALFSSAEAGGSLFF
ncbi:hypothetical protein pdul_cds_478 [Pandoravirus dulcis]|uniref:Uncharacterized protein n=1 Tax=Pandoravirus dulcis TaxID=1349409 RepID=S4VQL6_9VIRU|nr:hypothetical protein pdul_cds_478 [Pandoravirus dulcis]AGO82557.1 hypothetical protein pdul_cds_478 [Pandoravirus dulcis]